MLKRLHIGEVYQSSDGRIVVAVSKERVAWIEAGRIVECAAPAVLSRADRDDCEALMASWRCSLGELDMIARRYFVPRPSGRVADDQPRIRGAPTPQQRVVRVGRGGKALAG